MTAEDKIRDMVQRIMIDEGYSVGLHIEALKNKIEVQNKIIKILAGKVKALEVK